MNTSEHRRDLFCWFSLRSLCVLCVLCSSAFSVLLFLAPVSACAQEASLPALQQAQQEKPALPEKPQPKTSVDLPPDAHQKPNAKFAPPHRFWDKQNLWLFAGVGAMRALDYHSTGNMRRRGRDEILLTNEIVDNKPAFVAIEVAGAAASVGISYLFHRTNHHKLERWTSYVHIGVAGFGSVRNYCLKTRHPASISP